MEQVLHILDEDGRIVQYLLEAGHWIYLEKKEKLSLEFVWHRPGSWIHSCFNSPHRVTLCKHNIVTWTIHSTAHCAVNQSRLISLLKKFFLYSLIFFLLSPSLCWCWQLILWPSFILATANFGENKNPAPLIRLEGLQIEFSPSQCPLSWLSLGAKAGPWQRSKHQLTEFEMLESWQANEGNWRAVGIL